MWFKVDDKLHSHMKAAMAGVPALGLWVLAGSWCMDQLEDGFVPDFIARRLDPDAEEHATLLVDAGLWVPAKRGKVRGWRFHDWEAHQPSKAKVLHDREANAERVRDWRRRKAEEQVNEGNVTALHRSNGA